MTRSAQLSTESGYLMIDHISGLIANASRLREQALERAAAGDRTAAADLYGQAGSLASIAISFRYDLADAHADTKDADGLIAMLDKWAATLEWARALDEEPRTDVANAVFSWATE
ncbi:hypothetical protein [uncultured Parasphingorhabdus sp.]|uniref:hypothetical protein n=1 Tax=uncultured Parasphingorhabdus sp. TaxID=2709694 RepID=UPI0030D86563|tara:strand:- start:15544 stop:15888 length:345 start_codon:yes stop_codon:yes gene_type:complete